MDIERVAPQLRGRLRWAKPVGIEHALGRRAIAGLMAVMPRATVEGVTVEDRRDLALGLRIYRPATLRSDGALLFVHGGGLVIGRPVVNDRMCAEIAREVGIVVASPEYRKAPRHPFPAALDDVHEAWVSLLREAPSLGVDRTRIVIGGESAGGGIAAALAQRLHDEGGIQPAGQLLFCPMLDDRTSARRDLDVIDHFVWNNARNRFGWRSYLGHEPGSATPPDYAAPARREDCSGLPPAWIGYGAIELFHDEDAAYVHRLRAAGCAVEEDVVDGAPHGFEVWAPDTDLARAHTGRAHAWLRQRVSSAP